MRKHKLLALVLALVMVAPLVLAGCNNKSSSIGELDAEQVVNIVGYDYTSLEPSAESDAESFTTFQQVYESLMRETPDHQIVPAAAKSAPKISKDGLVYTFTIRDDAKWSDGKPVTANDFVFSWKRLIDPKNAYSYQDFLDMVKGVADYRAGKGKIEDVGIVAKNDKTLEVTLAYPVSYFDKMMTFGCLAPQREDIANALGDKYGQDWQKMVYNGPFTISNYQKGSVIEYTKNPQYWDAKNVKLEKAVCPIIDEQATLIQMFESKELDQTGATGDFIKDLDSKKDAGGYTHITGTQASSFFIYLGFKNNPVMSNVKIRQALAAAFDRQAYLDTVFKRNVVAYGIVPPAILVGDKVYRDEVAEPAKAGLAAFSDPKALFKEGLKELGMPEEAAKVKLLLLAGPQTSTSSAYTQFIQKQVESKIGAKVEIKFSVDGPTYFDDREAGNFDLCTGGWGADYNDVSSYFDVFKSTSSNNNGKYNNKQYDDLVAQAAKASKTADRINLYKQAEELLLVKDPAVISTYYADYQTFRYNYLKGLGMPLFGGYYALRDAYIQGKN